MIQLGWVAFGSPPGQPENLATMAAQDYIDSLDTLERNKRVPHAAMGVKAAA